MDVGNESEALSPNVENDLNKGNDTNSDEKSVSDTKETSDVTVAIEEEACTLVSEKTETSCCTTEIADKCGAKSVESDDLSSNRVEEDAADSGDKVCEADVIEPSDKEATEITQDEADKEPNEEIKEEFESDGGKGNRSPDGHENVDSLGNEKGNKDEDDVKVDPLDDVEMKDNSGNKELKINSQNDDGLENSQVVDVKAESQDIMEVESNSKGEQLKVELKKDDVAGNDSPDKLVVVDLQNIDEEKNDSKCGSVNTSTETKESGIDGGEVKDHNEIKTELDNDSGDGDKCQDAKLTVNPISEEKLNSVTKEEPVKVSTTPVESLRNMLEDIEEGELDYEEEGEVADEEDLPDLPEYDPSAHKKSNGYGSEEGEILSDNDKDAEREDGEIIDDEAGQVYICVDPVHDKWKKVSRDEQKRIQELEEGQIDEPDEPVVPSPPPTNTARFIPRTLCKYFNNGLCRWGSTCRFLHPGINDKGIPTDVQPTWNATAGNYVMHRPPGMYPNAYGKAPPPMECINVPVLPAPLVNMSLIPPGHTELLALPNVVGDMHNGIVFQKESESAWEKGLRRAKEIKEAAARRRIEDRDFEYKRLSMRIPEHAVDKDSDFEPGMDPGLSAEKTLNEWGIRSRDFKAGSDYYDRRHRDDRRSDRYFDRFSRQPKEVDRSSGRARLAELPPQHPIRRDERQRERERVRRERDEKDKELTEKDRIKIENIYKFDRLRTDAEKSDISDPRVGRHQNESNPTMKVPKAVGATEWHDPWMRSQQPPSAQIKTEAQKQPGVEAISDSESPSSDSDSDSDSSSSEKSSDSDSDSSSSSDDDKKATNGALVAGKPDVLDPRRRDRRPPRTVDEKQPVTDKVEKSEPLSYEEWKRLQTMQKAQYHQQMANQYKTALEYKEAMKKEHSPLRIKDTSRVVDQKPSVFEDPNAIPPKRPNQVPPYPQSHVEKIDKVPSMRNDDKFDSPKRNTPSEKNSDSGSDSDSDSDSDSASSNSDSDDSDSDSDSDSDLNANVMAAVVKPVKPASVDTNARKDIRVNLSEKPKPDIEIPSLAGKRPARKDELLKELKAVEDAIARKRAKID